MIAKGGYISGFVGLSCLAAGGFAHAQMTDPEIDYSDLLAEYERQQEEQWRPLFELVLEETEAEIETDEYHAIHATAEDKHASKSALFLPDEDGQGGLLLLPRQTEFEMALGTKGCETSRPSSDQIENRAAVYSGNGASFALRGVPSDCESPGLAFSSEGDKDHQDVGLYLSPALAECLDGACSLRGVKGEIRVGELKETEDGEGGWYMYAAADGTRVVWDERPSGILNLQDAVDVSESLTMGDLEAGILLSSGFADLSVNYVHRRSKFSTWDEKVVDNADYVGVKISFD